MIELSKRREGVRHHNISEVLQYPGRTGVLTIIFTSVHVAVLFCYWGSSAASASTSGGSYPNSSRGSYSTSSMNAKKTMSTFQTTAVKAPGSPVRQVQIFTIQDPAGVPSVAGKGTYDHVIQDGPEKDVHLYSEVTVMNSPANDTKNRLESIEGQHNLLREDFNQFKNEITSQLDSLKEINTSLITLVADSSQKLQESMDKLLLKFSENSDHLGQQILDVRREIISAAKKQQPSTSQSTTAHKHVHSFDWEVSNIDSLLKSQKECLSHVYHIPHIDYKTHGSVVCQKDGRMRLKLFGEFGQNLSRNSLPRNTKFECTAHVVDRSEKLQELFVGRTVGDFNSRNEWLIGEFSTSDVKKRGYVTKGGHICLRFTIEMSE